MRPRLCRCDAYRFPHREGGGACSGDPERGDEDAADRWLSYLLARGYRTIDGLLDDPRRGQAAAINRERKP